MDLSHTLPNDLDKYQLVTDKIVAQFEKGVIPWQKPIGTAGIPMNLLNRQYYRSINVWLLIALNYERNLFLTNEQLICIGGSVLDGEKGNIIISRKPTRYEKPNEDAHRLSIQCFEIVFNIAQCKDIPEFLLASDDMQASDYVSRCQAVLELMYDTPSLIFNGSESYYDHVIDAIVLPQLKKITGARQYYGTLFHELIHSTGAAKRLNRKTLVDMGSFGSERYTMEELIAEMGGAYLAHFSGVHPNEISHSVDYIDTWLGVFKSNKHFVLTTSEQAQHAIDFLLQHYRGKLI